MSKIYMKVVIKCGGCPHVKASMSGLAVNRWMCWAVDPAREVYLLEIPVVPTGRLSNRRCDSEGQRSEGGIS